MLKDTFLIFLKMRELLISAGGGQVVYHFIEIIFL
jgi:hypothetical protein